jgi:DNA primase
MTKKYSKQELMDLLEELHPVLDGTGNNLTIDCPECGERECSISLDLKNHQEGHKFGCFRLKHCGARGNIWTVLKKLGKVKNFFSSFNKANPDFIDINSLSLGKNYVSDAPVNDEVDLDLPTVINPLGWTRTFDDDYLNSRGYDAYQYDMVGRTTMHPSLKHDYIIFLIQENNETKGYLGRHTWSKEKITEYNNNYEKTHGIKNKIKRYNNSYKTDFSKMLYGFDELDEKSPVPVCLVEGIFDKRAVDKKLYLHENPFIRTCATFKCFVSDTQIAKLKLKNVTDVILFYDPDVIKQIKKNVQKLQCFFNVKVIIAPFNKDPDEMQQEEVIEVFENHLYTPEQIQYNFLQLNKIKF